MNSITRPGDELSREVRLVEEHLRTKKLSVTIVRLQLRLFGLEFHRWIHIYGELHNPRWPRTAEVQSLIESCRKPDIKHFYKKVSFDVDAMLRYVYEGRCAL